MLNPEISEYEDGVTNPLVKEIISNSEEYIELGSDKRLTEQESIEKEGLSLSKKDDKGAVCRKCRKEKSHILQSAEACE
jgi:hypothetical protein